MDDAFMGHMSEVRLKVPPGSPLAVVRESPSVRGRTWKGGSPTALGNVRELLLRRGAVEDRDLKNPREAWRVRIETAVFTGYRSGTIYCNGGDIPELLFLYKSISEILGQTGR